MSRLDDGAHDDRRRSHGSNGAGRHGYQHGTKRQSGGGKYIDLDRPEMERRQDASSSNRHGFSRQGESQLRRTTSGRERHGALSTAARLSGRRDTRQDTRPSSRSPSRAQKRRRGDSVSSDGSRSTSRSRDRQGSRRDRRADSRDRSPSPRRHRRSSPVSSAPQVVSAARWLDFDSPEAEEPVAPTRIPRDPSQPIPRLRAASPLSDPVFRYCLSFPISLFPIIRGPDGARTRQLVAYSNLFRLSLMQPKGEKSGYAQLIGSKAAIKEGWEAVKEVLRDHLPTMNPAQKKDCEFLSSWPVAGDGDMEALGESKEEFAVRAQTVVAGPDNTASLQRATNAPPRPRLPTPPPSAPLAVSAEERPRWRGLPPAGSPPSPHSLSASAIAARLNTIHPPPHQQVGLGFTRPRDQGWAPRTNEPLPPQDVNAPPFRGCMVPPPPPPPMGYSGRPFLPPPGQPPRSHPPRDAHWLLENRRSGMLRDRFHERGVPAFWIRLPGEACGAVVGKEQHKLVQLERNSDTLLWVDGKGDTPSVLYVWGIEAGAIRALHLVTRNIRSTVLGHDEWEGVLMTYAGDVVPCQPLLPVRQQMPARTATLYRPAPIVTRSPPRGRERGRSPTPRRRSASPRGRSPSARDRSHSRGRSYSSRSRSYSRSQSRSRSRSRTALPRRRAPSYSRTASREGSTRGSRSASPNRRQRGPSTYRYSPPPAPQRSPSPHRPWQSPRKSSSYHDLRRTSSTSFPSPRARSLSPLYAPPDDLDIEGLAGAQPKETLKLTSSHHSSANTATSSASSTFSAVQEAVLDELAEALASPPSSVSSNHESDKLQHSPTETQRPQLEAASAIGAEEEQPMDVDNPITDEQPRLAAEELQAAKPSCQGYDESSAQSAAVEEEQYSPTSPPPEKERSPVVEEAAPSASVAQLPEVVEQGTLKQAALQTVGQTSTTSSQPSQIPALEAPRIVKLVDSAGVAKVVEMRRENEAPVSQALSIEEVQRAVEMVRRAELGQQINASTSSQAEVQPSPAAAHRPPPLVIDTSIPYDDIFAEVYNDDFFSMYTSFPDSPVISQLGIPCFDGPGPLAHLHGSGAPPSSPINAVGPAPAVATPAVAPPPPPPPPVPAVSASPLPFTSFSDDEDEEEDEILLAPMPTQAPTKDALFLNALHRISEEPSEFLVSDDSSDSDRSDDEVVEGHPAPAPGDFTATPLVPFAFPFSTGSTFVRRQGLSRSLLPAGRPAAPKTLADAHRELNAAQSALEALGPAPAPLKPQEVAARKEAKMRRKSEKEQRALERRKRNGERKTQRERVEVGRRLKRAKECVEEMEKRIVA